MREVAQQALMLASQDLVLAVAGGGLSPKSTFIPWKGLTIPWEGVPTFPPLPKLALPEPLGWFGITLGKLYVGQQREGKLEAPSQHMNTLQGKALEGILMTSILFPVNFVLILGTNTGNE